MRPTTSLPERIEKVRTDDAELLKLAYEWLRSSMFAEETLKFREGVLEARKDRADATMRKVYGKKEKGQIGDMIGRQEVSRPYVPSCNIKLISS